MPRDADLFSTQLETVAPPPTTSADPIEVWAKRIGRIDLIDLIDHAKRIDLIDLIDHAKRIDLIDRIDPIDLIDHAKRIDRIDLIDLIDLSDPVDLIAPA